MNTPTWIGTRRIVNGAVVNKCHRTAARAAGTGSPHRGVRGGGPTPNGGGVMRILPADVYDALELSAEAFGGGIGGGFYQMDGVPYCAIGHASHAADSMIGYGPIFAALTDAGIHTQINDRAIRSINARLACRDALARVPFTAWCAELNVTRGT